ncbi:MAG TPA: hypothetical protein PKE04_22395, partial [Clostridia bacterium]|nr:hypothetical protein [Clostridia bacterium]
MTSKQQGLGLHIPLAGPDRSFYAAIGCFLFLLILAILYPIALVLSSSLSSPAAVYAGRVFLWPVDVSL